MAIFPSSAIPTAAATSFSIDNSLRFNSADSAYLSWTPGSGGNRKTWTYSFWYKRCKFGSRARIIGTTDPWEDLIRFENNDKLLILSGESSGYTSLTTTQVFRDPSAWYHIVFAVDTTQATASNRAKLYVNGSQVTAFDTETYASQNLDSEFNDSTVHYMGSSAQYIDGYLAEVHFIDGTALTPTSFGEEDADYKHWKPIEVTGLTYGTNGFHLDFATSGTLGNDANGSNNWTANNLAATDQMLDSPTNNFCTMHPDHALSEGNLKVSCSAGGERGGLGTMSVSSGKWYWEAYVTGTQAYAGFTESHDVGANESGGRGYSNGGALQYRDGTINVYNNGGFISDISENGTQSDNAISAGGIMQIALDLDNNKAWFGVDGTWVNSGNPVTSSNQQFDLTNKPSITPVAFGWGGGGSILNFGQDSSFSGY